MSNSPINIDTIDNADWLRIVLGRENLVMFDVLNTLKELSSLLDHHRDAFTLQEQGVVSVLDELIIAYKNAPGRHDQRTHGRPLANTWIKMSKRGEEPRRIPAYSENQIAQIEAEAEKRGYSVEIENFSVTDFVPENEQRATALAIESEQHEDYGDEDDDDNDSWGGLRYGR